MTWLRHRAGLRELLDEPTVDRATLERNLQDLRRINRWLGWTRTMTRAVARELARDARRPWSLLDVATGSADLPLAVARWAARRGEQPRLIALDLSAAVLSAAAAYLGGHGTVALARGDALRLPFRDASIDVVTCALTLHHFPPTQAVDLLRELGRVSGGALVLSDLERGWTAHAGARLLWFVTRNPMTRHDAPVSVLRAYTAAELRALAHAAGLDGARVSRQFPMRLTLTWRRAEACATRRPGD